MSSESRRNFTFVYDYGVYNLYFSHYVKLTGTGSLSTMKRVHELNSTLSTMYISVSLVCFTGCRTR